MSTMPVLITDKLSVGYSKKNRGHTTILNDLNLSIQPGQVVCLLGPNGSGKSTLIRSLAGLQPVLQGKISILGSVLAFRYPSKTAQMLSVVLTDRIEVSHLTVSELVSMGRYPYSRWFGRTFQLDRKKIHQALEQVHLQDFSGRILQELSDGELQRVMIAKALVQDTPVILLDEPTAHLDLPNRIETMKLLRRLAKDTGKAVLLSTHDLELALQTADLLWLIHKDKPVITGLPEDLVLNGTFEDTFRSDNVHFDPESGTYRIHHDTKYQIRLKGNTLRGFWTKRAFERESILLHPDIQGDRCIYVLDGDPGWGYGNSQGPQRFFNTIQELLTFIKEEKLYF